MKRVYRKLLCIAIVTAYFCITPIYATNADLTPKNAKQYLFTATPDGFNQVVHPDIVYFKNGFNGYKYYLAITPYPYGNQKYENPCILVSNDGLHFTRPIPLKNPIVPPPSNIKLGGHLSDPDMYYANGRFVLHYVYNRMGQLGPSLMFKTKSRDAIHWSRPEIVYRGQLNMFAAAPGFVEENHVVKMWFMQGNNIDADVYFAESRDNEKTWTSPIKLNLQRSGIWSPWHVDVIKTDIGYEGLLCSRIRNSQTRALFYMRSTNGLKWEVTRDPILAPHNGYWDDSMIYRSTMIKENGLYRVWYSARGTNKQWHMGYTTFTGKELEHFMG